MSLNTYLIQPHGDSEVVQLVNILWGVFVSRGHVSIWVHWFKVSVCVCVCVWASHTVAINCALVCGIAICEGEVVSF